VLALRALVDGLRPQTLGRGGFQQIQLDVHYMRPEVCCVLCAALRCAIVLLCYAVLCCLLCRAGYAPWYAVLCESGRFHLSHGQPNATVPSGGRDSWPMFCKPGPYACPAGMCIARLHG
jgi:hypothetical protein